MSKEAAFSTFGGCAFGLSPLQFGIVWVGAVSIAILRFLLTFSLLNKK